MHQERQRRVGRTSILSVIAGVVTGGFILTVAGLGGVALPVASAVADTSSAVTIAAAAQDLDIAHSPLPGLVVTVSQTADLQNQGILISWTGGLKSSAPSGQVGGENFLQIAQCWGNDPANAAAPDRTTCQYGGLGTPGASRDSNRSDPANVDPLDQQYTVAGSGFSSPTYTSIPFKARSGVVVSSIKQVNGVNVHDPTVDVNTNQFFTVQTTNEVSWAGSGADGTGSAKMEMQTAAQSPGLGCGAAIGSGDSVKGASCWLVIIPRGVADLGENHIIRSGLFEDAWKHRIAFKLDFRALGVRCAIGAAERQLSGSELVGAAVASWQPTLCSAAGGSAYTIITGAESDAAAAANGAAVAPMALTSRALSTGGADHLKYAPIALTGLSISFAIDRFPNPFGAVPQDVLDRAYLPFTSLNLTPRLVAKLLTNSYLQALPPDGKKSHIDVHNSQNLVTDPDFLAVNDPEWKYQSIPGPAGLADLLLPQGRSDAAWALWTYVMSDADAVAFLSGTADPWGMVVNPWSSIVATTNPSGAALQLPRDNFPKADPIESPATPTGGAVNLVTWRPFTNDLDTSAYLTLRGDPQVLGSWDPFSIPPKFTKKPRDIPGFQKVLSLTDTASAGRYRTVSASLLNPAGQFVAPTTESLLAAAAVMTADPAQPQVTGFDPTSAGARAASHAYPLAMPVYAAVNPAMTDAAVRLSYSSFIQYAATTGQSPGVGLGQLPGGYAPIPTGWQTQALAAAAAIKAGPVPAPSPSPSPSNSSGSSNGSSTSGSGSAAVPAPQPSATGAPAGSLSGGKTGSDPDTTAISSAVPLSLAGGLLAALAVPFISRIRRPL